MSRRHIDCHQEPDPLTAEAAADQSQEPAAGSVPAAEAQEAGRLHCFKIFLWWLVLCGSMDEPSPPPPVAHQPRQEAAAAGQPVTEPHEAEAGRGAVYYYSSSSSSPTFWEYMDRLRGRAKELEGKADPAASCSTHFQGGGRKIEKEATSSSSGTFEQEEEEEEEEEEGSGVETMKDQSLAQEVIGCSIASPSASHLRQESAVRVGTSGIDSIPRTRSMEDVERLSYSPDISSGNVSAASSAQSCSNDSANATTSSGHAKSVGDQEGDEDDMGGSTTKGDNEGDE